MPSRLSLIDVGAVEDFLEGRPRVVEVGGRELGIIQWRDAFYAVRNVCAHMGARLCLGTVTARVSSDGPMSPIEADYSNPVLTCPWHGWKFDVRTGSFTVIPTLKVRTYKVKEQDGSVMVEIP